jgi:hypothetical protein
MYNTNLTINYITIDGDDGDTNYRKQLLEFLHLDMYDDNVTIKIDKLYDLYKNEVEITRIMPYIKEFIEQRMPFEMEGKTRFLFLFSFDFFHAMYPIICCFIKKKSPIKQQIDTLIDIIISKFKIKS